MGHSVVLRCQKSRRNSNDVTPTGAPNRGGVGSNRAISTTEQLCRSDAVPPQHCVRPRWPTPTTRLRWRSDIGLLLSTTSSRSLLRLLCLFQLTVCSHDSVCISRASCFYIVNAVALFSLSVGAFTSDAPAVQLWWAYRSVTCKDNADEFFSMTTLKPSKVGQCDRVFLLCDQVFTSLCMQLLRSVRLWLISRHIQRRTGNILTRSYEWLR